MVTENSPSNSNSSILHQFIMSNSIANQNHFGNQHFDAYTTTDNYANSLPALGIQFLGERMSRTVDLVHHPPQQSDESDIARDHCLIDLLGASNEAASQQAQRLSLSLGSVPCRQRPFHSSFLNPGYPMSGESARESCNAGLGRVINDYSVSGTSFAPSAAVMNQTCSTSYGNQSFAAAIGNSKYLRPAQSILEEMVSVAGKEIDETNQKYVEKLTRGSRNGSFGLSSELKAEISNTELLTEKHGTYINLLKLLAMLEEVERRYEEYYHHMEQLISSFEVIAGLGTGKSYTALALQAMSKHFCTLRNSILLQIRATKQKIAKDTPKMSSRLSQLCLFDQNRVSLQQLGLVPSLRQAWRPIRGLPETSVTILRAWLFEHFLHPYPNDSEKIMLASQTGLSKNQVSNWFINARVRLWKPMIEEMYKDEFAESSTESDQFLIGGSTTREGVGDSAEDFNG